MRYGRAIEELICTGSALESGAHLAHRTSKNSATTTCEYDGNLSVFLFPNWERVVVGNLSDIVGPNWELGKWER